MKTMRMRCLVLIAAGCLLLSVGASARDLLNVWHIPTNEEPPTVTMRNPVTVNDDDGAVYFYVGGWPYPHMTSANLIVRSGGGAWDEYACEFDSVQGNNNEYFIVHIDGPFTGGSTFEYYFECIAAAFETTYVYGDDTTTATTADEMTAQGGAFSFTIGGGPPASPTPTPTPGGATATPTPTGTHAGSATPTPNTSPTATPLPNQCEADIMTNAEVYYGGDFFRLVSMVCNSGTPTTADVYVCLNIGNGYWFHPDWTEQLQSEALQMDTEHCYQKTLLQFNWPLGVGTIDPFTFFLVVTQPGNFQVLAMDTQSCAAY